jgi:hypothetical protein
MRNGENLSKTYFSGQQIGGGRSPLPDPAIGQLVHNAAVTGVLATLNH